jgi:hypothetical protein
LAVYFVKDGNQMAKEPSVARFGTLEVPDHDPHQVGYVLGVEPTELIVNSILF